MPPPPLTRDQCREIDRRAVEQLGMTSLVLMENAGRGCVDLLERLGIGGPVVILCGKGNNAGDGFVIARHLQIRGYACRVVLLAPADELRGDAAANFAILRKAEGQIVDLSRQPAGAVPSPSGSASSSAFTSVSSSAASSTLAEQLSDQAGDADWILDAMLGTGASGEPRPPLDQAIDWMNSQPVKKLAIDVPSGLDCDTGEPAAHTVRADHTCTFAAPKVGFTLGAAQEYVGKVHVCDIGVPLRPASITT